MEVERELLLEFLFMAMERLQTHVTDRQLKRYKSSCMSLRKLLGLSVAEAYKLYIADNKER